MDWDDFKEDFSTVTGIVVIMLFGAGMFALMDYYWFSKLTDYQSPPLMMAYVCIFVAVGCVFFLIKKTVFGDSLSANSAVKDKTQNEDPLGILEIMESGRGLLDRESNPVALNPVEGKRDDPLGIRQHLDDRRSR